MTQTTRTRAPRARASAKEVVAEEAPLVTHREKKRISMHPSTLVLLMLLIVAIGAAGYFYYQSKYAAQIADSKEIEELTKTIGQFVELPVDETPTLATVTDREKLADQTFFIKAENGDKVLIYSNSGKAILYRPSTKKIVDMTSVNINQPAANTESAPQAQTEETLPSESTEAPIEKKITVALYNGGIKVGVTDAAEKQINAGLPEMQVALKEKAVKSDYVGTVVVDVSGSNPDKATALASLLGAKVGSLPSGEVTPQADIAVIIGNTEALAPTPAPEEKKKD